MRLFIVHAEKIHGNQSLVFTLCNIKLYIIKTYTHTDTDTDTHTHRHTQTQTPRHRHTPTHTDRPTDSRTPALTQDTENGH